MKIKQFEIWIADLNPRFGTENLVIDRIIPNLESREVILTSELDLD